MIVEALAAARLTRLVVDDTITEPLRELLEENAPDRVAELVRCRWCVGIWAAGFVWVTRRPLRQAWRVLALAEAASLIVGVPSEQLRAAYDEGLRDCE